MFNKIKLNIVGINYIWAISYKTCSTFTKRKKFWINSNILNILTNFDLTKINVSLICEEYIHHIKLLRYQDILCHYKKTWKILNLQKVNFLF